MAEPQREWFEKDFYKVLGVAENASDKDITDSFTAKTRGKIPYIVKMGEGGKGKPAVLAPAPKKPKLGLA